MGPSPQDKTKSVARLGTGESARRIASECVASAHRAAPIHATSSGHFLTLSMLLSLFGCWTRSVRQPYKQFVVTNRCGNQWSSASVRKCVPVTVAAVQQELDDRNVHGYDRSATITTHNNNTLTRRHTHTRAAHTLLHTTVSGL